MKSAQFCILGQEQPLDLHLMFWAYSIHLRIVWQAGAWTCLAADQPTYTVCRRTYRGKGGAKDAENETSNAWRTCD